MNSHKVTEQITAAGRAIEEGSFAIIDREVGPHAYAADQWPLVRRLIHASGDFEFNGLAAFHPGAVTAGLAAIRRGAPILADVEMIRAGLSAARLAHFGMDCHQFISDPDVIAQAKSENSTRAVQAMRKAQRLGLLDGAIVAVGNAPTALIETLRLIREEGARPALVIGMPVGFVSAAESKELLAGISDVKGFTNSARAGMPRSGETPWISVRGRKGGSTLVVAAIHALLAMAE